MALEKGFETCEMYALWIARKSYVTTDETVWSAFCLSQNSRGHARS